MPVYEASREIEIAAPPGAVFDVLTDYERMPEWSSRICEAHVLARDADGRAAEVQYTIDAVLRKVRYRLAQSYRAPGFIGSRYLGGDFRNFEGEYELVPAGAGSHVTFRLRVDPGLRVPGRVARMLAEQVMGRALSDLRSRVEAA